MKTLMLLALAACGHDSKAGETPEFPNVPTFAVTSTAFAASGEIPMAHTCEGADTPPPLAWAGAPPTTKSFAVIVDDPDAPDPAAPKTTWVHWVVVNLPATASTIPNDAVAGKNDFGKQAWGGPCPPIGRHRYHFKVYALDADGLGKPGMTKAELLAAIKEHVIARGELVGTYQKQKKN